MGMTTDQMAASGQTRSKPRVPAISTSTSAATGTKGLKIRMNEERCVELCP